MNEPKIPRLVFIILLPLILLSIFTVISNTNNDEELFSVVAILPPVITIVAAFILRQVIVALFLGIWFGAWTINGGDTLAIFTSLIDVSNKYAVNALRAEEHVLIIIASLFIGGMMGVISVNGGMQGVVSLMLRWVKSKKQVQLTTMFIGLFIFFDDYANALITGNTMRPVTDKMKISREKLAYIVDSTAAPVASVAIISLWIGYQVSLIDNAIKSIDNLTGAYAIFLNSLAYSFYPFLALIFVFMVIISGRDFGPMLNAEKRSVAEDATGKVCNLGIEMKKNKNLASASNAIIPTLTLLLTVILGIFLTGKGDNLQDIISSSNSLVALTLGGFFGSIAAIVISMIKNNQTLNEVIDAWLVGVNTVTAAVVILILSWSLADISHVLHTPEYLISIIGDNISMVLLPTVIFIFSAVIALGTGTAWGTMAILMPLTIPLAWQLIYTSDAALMATDMHILYSSIAAVLTGAVWGDHCSPISDTTILSSMATQCNHLDHVRTQMPYALFVGLVAICFGSLPAAFGISWGICYLMSIIVLWSGLRMLGQPSYPNE